MDVEPLTAGRLLDRDRDVPASPAAGRPHLMGRMDPVDKGDGLIDAHRVEQVLVAIDESLLFGVVEAARHGLRLAIVKAQAMQQGDQARAAVAQRQCPLQPSPDLADAARAVGVDPIGQSHCLLVGQAAAAALMAKALQRFDPASLKSPMPVANRIVIQQQSLRDALATPALVEKDNGVRPPGDPMLRKPVSREPDQSSTVVGRKKSAANHAPSRIPFGCSVKRFSATQ